LGADLRRANLDRTILENANLTATILADTNIDRAKLSQTTLRGNLLQGTDLSPIVCVITNVVNCVVVPNSEQVVSPELPLN
jgi:uncharacterized protein YjbI with pentapeptide repeats